MHYTKTFFFIFLFFAQIVVAQTDNEIYKQAVNIYNEANQLQAKRDYENSKLSFAKAADLFEKAGYQGNYIQCKMSEGMILLFENKFAEAEEILLTAKNRAIADFGEDNSFLVNTDYFLGRLEFVKGNIDRANTLFSNSLVLLKKYPNPDPFLEAKLYSGLGNISLAQGKYKKAYEYHKKDLNFRIDKGDVNAPELSIVYTNLSIVKRSSGDLNAAYAYIDKALAHSNASQGVQSPAIANLYSVKGSIYFDLGQYNSAKQLMLRALEIKNNIHGEKHMSVANEYNNLGQVYKGLKNLDKALVSYRKAYEIQKQILGKVHPDIAITCSNIASILRKQDKKESALKFYNEAINIISSIYGDNHPDLASYYHNLALLYRDSKNEEKEMEFYVKARDILEAEQGTMTHSLILIYTNIAELLRRQKKYYSSMQNYQKALKANVLGYNPAEGEFFTNPKLANYKDLNYMLYAVKGKAEAMTAMYMRDSLYEYAEYSYKSYLLCDSIINRSRKSVVNQDDKLTLGNKTRNIYKDALLSATVLGYIQNSEKQKQEYYKKAFYFSEKNKAGVLSDAVNASEAKKFSGIPDSVLQVEKNISRQIAAVKNELLKSYDEKVQKKLKNKLFTLSNEYRRFSDDIERQYPKYFQAKYKQKNIQVADIQKALEKNQVVRSYFLSPDEIIIFTLTHDNIKVWSEAKPENFESEIKDMISYLTSGLKSEFSKYLQISNTIYKVLFPVELPENISELIIIPDGILGVIPFEALTTKEYSGDIMAFGDYPFLIKDYKINYFYSASLFLQSLQNKNKKKGVDNWLGLAPIFSNLESRKIEGFYASELPGTLDEIKKISSNIENNSGSAVKYLGEEVTESKIKALDFSDYDVVHIATHGTVDTENPELSGLLFYPEQGKEDNILYSGEIYNLNLNTDLVVLSACETGLGKVSKSEGVIGLTRSFLYAGANNVIVSLWKVEDSSTSDLMQYFYDFAIQGNTWSESLHKAKLKMMERGGKYAHPFFWSPFVLIGR